MIFSDAGGMSVDSVMDDAFTFFLVGGEAGAGSVAFLFRARRSSSIFLRSRPANPKMPGAGFEGLSVSR